MQLLSLVLEQLHQRDQEITLTNNNQATRYKQMLKVAGLDVEDHEFTKMVYDQKLEEAIRETYQDLEIDVRLLQTDFPD